MNCIIHSDQRRRREKLQEELIYVVFTLSSNTDIGINVPKTTAHRVRLKNVQVSCLTQ